MRWTPILNDYVFFLLFFLIACFVILVSMLFIIENVKIGVPLIVMFISGVFNIGLIHYGLFVGLAGLTDKEYVVLHKAEEILDAKTFYIEKEQGPEHYGVTAGEKEYFFLLSDKGMNVESVYEGSLDGGDLVYQSTEENLDEGLNSIGKLATSKVREITGSESAFIVDYLYRDEFVIESNDKLYTVKVDEGNGVEYVLHNDVYIYRK